jgi:hypothetical protein
MASAGILWAPRMKLQRVTTLSDGLGLTQNFVGNNFE